MYTAEDVVDPGGGGLRQDSRQIWIGIAAENKERLMRLFSLALQSGVERLLV